MYSLMNSEPEIVVPDIEPPVMVLPTMFSAITELSKATSTHAPFLAV
nr:MAG: hypothetical protein [Bacteriophage sp.]